MVELTSVVKNYPLRTKNILIRYCGYCIYCDCYIEDWVNGAETGILPQKQTSAWWWRSGGCSPCCGGADDNVHDAGESHHTFWLMLEPGNVFFTSGFRLFPDIVVDSKILGKISVQTKRSFVCCEGLKILLLLFLYKIKIVSSKSWLYILWKEEEQ